VDSRQLLVDSHQSAVGSDKGIGEIGEIGGLIWLIRLIRLDHLSRVTRYSSLFQSKVGNCTNPWTH